MRNTGDLSVSFKIHKEEILLETQIKALFLSLQSFEINKDVCLGPDEICFYVVRVCACAQNCLCRVR